MKILFIASGNQQIASIMCALDRMGHETGMYPKSIETVDSIEDEEKRLKTFLMRPVRYFLKLWNGAHFSGMGRTDSVFY